jgi:hypothetical protein
MLMWYPAPTVSPDDSSRLPSILCFVKVTKHSEL